MQEVFPHILKAKETAQFAQLLLAHPADSRYMVYNAVHRTDAAHPAGASTRPTFRGDKTPGKILDGLLTG